MPRHAIFDDYEFNPSATNRRVQRLRTSPRSQRFIPLPNSQETVASKRSKWEERFSESNYHHKNRLNADFSDAHVDGEASVGVMRATADAMLHSHLFSQAHRHKILAREGGPAEGDHTHREKIADRTTIDTAPSPLNEARSGNNNNTSTTVTSETIIAAPLTETPLINDERREEEGTLLHFLGEVQNPHRHRLGVAVDIHTNEREDGLDYEAESQFERELARARAVLEARKQRPPEKVVKDVAGEDLSSADEGLTFAEAVLESVAHRVDSRANLPEGDIYGILGLAPRHDNTASMTLKTEERRIGDDETITQPTPGAASGAASERSASLTTDLQRSQIHGDTKSILDRLLEGHASAPSTHRRGLDDDRPRVVEAGIQTSGGVSREYSKYADDRSPPFGALPQITHMIQAHHVVTMPTMEADFVEPSQRHEDGRDVVPCRSNRSEHCDESDQLTEILSFVDPVHVATEGATSSDFPADDTDDAKRTFSNSPTSSFASSHVPSDGLELDSNAKQSDKGHRINAVGEKGGLHRTVSSQEDVRSSRRSLPSSVEEPLALASQTNDLQAFILQLTQQVGVLVSVEESSARSILDAAEAMAFESLSARFEFGVDQIRRRENSSTGVGELVAALRAARAVGIEGSPTVGVPEEDNSDDLPSGLVQQLVLEVVGHAKDQLEARNKADREVRAQRVYDTIREASLAAASEVVTRVVPQDTIVAEVEAIALEASKAAAHATCERHLGDASSEEGAKEKLLAMLTRVATQAASEAASISISRNRTTFDAIVPSISEVNAAIEGAVGQHRLMPMATIENDDDLATADAFEHEEDVAEPLLIEEAPTARTPTRPTGLVSSVEPTDHGDHAQGTELKHTEAPSFPPKTSPGLDVVEVPESPLPLPYQGALRQNWPKEKPSSSHHFLYLDEECFDRLVPSPTRSSPHAALRRYRSSKNTHTVLANPAALPTSLQPNGLHVHPKEPDAAPSSTATVAPPEEKIFTETAKIYWGSMGNASGVQHEGRLSSLAEVTSPVPSTSFTVRSSTPTYHTSAQRTLPRTKDTALNRTPPKLTDVVPSSSNGPVYLQGSRGASDLNFHDSENSVRRLKAQLEELRLRSRR